MRSAKLLLTLINLPVVVVSWGGTIGALSNERILGDPQIIVFFDVELCCALTYRDITDARLNLTRSQVSSGVGRLFLSRHRHRRRSQLLSRGRHPVSHMLLVEASLEQGVQGCGWWVGGARAVMMMVSDVGGSAE